MTTTVAHFSDIHITDAPADIPWSRLVGKRAAGWVNLKFRGRYEKFAEAAEITRAFLRDLEDVRPDHVLFTGDVTGMSLPNEFRRATDCLASHLDEGAVIGIPGNHDVYTRGAARSGRYAEHFENWGPSTPTEGPRVVPLGPNADAILLVDSKPNHILDSSGRLGDAQLDRLEKLLASDEWNSRARIIALHYGPLRSDGTPDTYLHGLRDGPRFLEIVDRAGVELIVHGHLHKRFVLDRGSENPTVCTPGSLTHRSYDRAYHLYDIASDGSIRLRIRRFDADSQCFREDSGDALIVAGTQRASEQDT
ncbi:MAG: metallophosphoesterase [Planctomycetota bacterium]